jgi:hypothetical protein
VLAWKCISSCLIVGLVELEISLFLLRRLLGVKTDDKKQTKAYTSCGFICPDFSDNGAMTGTKTGQERSSDGEHRINVYWRASHERQSRPRQDSVDFPGLH